MPPILPARNLGLVCGLVKHIARLANRAKTFGVTEGEFEPTFEPRRVSQMTVHASSF
jgi:hypothetical protein